MHGIVEAFGVRIIIKARYNTIQKKKKKRVDDLDGIQKLQ